VAVGVAGGDGSASAAAAVAQAAGKPLAIIPAGTLNHLAGDLGVEDLGETVRAIRERRTIAMDTAEIDGRSFVNAASIGGYPHLVDEREALESTVGKWPAVLVSLVRILRSHDPIEVEIDGRRRTIWMMFVGNCRFEADGIAPTRRGRLDDGLLDVRIIHAERPWGRARVLLAAASGRIARCAVYERHKVTQLHVRSLDGPLRLARDGESFQGSEEFTIRKRAEPLAVFQPS
jgi:diacylglycerol kinase family enzyme